MLISIKTTNPYEGNSVALKELEILVHNFFLCLLLVETLGHVCTMVKKHAPSL